MPFLLWQFESAQTYEGVKALYEKSPLVTGVGLREEARTLSIHKKKYVTIREIHVGEYACRYHDTDVVIWHSPTEFSVSLYPSLSTNAFANGFTPPSLEFLCQYDLGYVVKAQTGTETRLYELARTERTSFTKKDLDVWLPVNPIKTSFIDPHASLLRSSLLKTNYFAFAQWSHGVMSFDQKPWSFNLRESAEERIAMREAEDQINKHGIGGLLADTNKWMYLIQAARFAVLHQSHSITARREAILSALRTAIYQEFDAVKTMDVEWYDARAFARQRQLQAKYPWAR